MKGTFSIIVPVFNTEKYLRKCIDSLISQNYKNYEIIAVNDGSTDRCGEILDEYKAVIPYFKVIHQINKGIGSAICEGIRHSKNDFIVFVDSDDYIEEDMLLSLHKIIEQDKEIDVLQFGLNMVNDAGEILRQEKHGDYEVIGEENIIRNHFQNHPTPSLACRVFRRELFDDLKWPEQNIGIDEILIVQLLAKSRKLVSIDETFYYVFLREESVSRCIYTEKKIKEYETVYEELFKFAEDRKPMYQNYIGIKYLKLLIGICTVIEKNSHYYNELLDKYNYKYQEIKKTREYREETISFRLGAAVFYRSPFFYEFIKKWL